MLVAAIGFRNVLAHEYGRVDYVEVYQTLQSGLEVYDAFSRQIAQWFQQHSNTEPTRGQGVSRTR